MSDAKDLPIGRSLARADAAQRAERAYRLRLSGLTWDEVAREVGFSDAPGAVRSVRNYLGALPELDRAELRTLWRGRLERLWRQAETDVMEQRPGAVRSAVAVSQRAAQLDALDVPAVSVIVSPTVAEFDATVAALITAHGGDVRPTEADIFAAEEDEGAPAGC